MVEQSAACMHACINHFRHQILLGGNYLSSRLGFGVCMKPSSYPAKTDEISRGTISALTHAKLGGGEIKKVEFEAIDK